MWLSGIVACQTGGGRPDGPDGLRRRAVLAADDAAVFWTFLRTGGGGSGAEFADRQHTAPGQRHFLYGCERKGSAGGVGCGIFAGDCRVPGSGPPRCPGRASASADFRRRPDNGADSPLGQWKRSPGPCQRAAGSGDVAGKPGRRSAGRSQTAVDTGDASLSGGPAGASASGGPGAAAPAGPVPGSGYFCRAAAVCPDRLGGDLWNTLSKCDGGAVPYDTRHRICGSLGRRCEKRRRP